MQGMGVVVAISYLLFFPPISHTLTCCLFAFQKLSFSYSNCFRKSIPTLELVQAWDAQMTQFRLARANKTEGKMFRLLGKQALSFLLDLILEEYASEIFAAF